MATFTEAKPAGTPTWIDLMAPDLDAARAFYAAVFGWEYDIGGPEFRNYTTARLGARPVAGMAGPAPDEPPPPAAWSLYFATDDIAADVARALELGATLVFPAMAVGAFGSMAVCTDPAGATFCFWQAGQHVGAQITEAPGAMAWHELYSPHAAQSRDFYTALLGASADAMPGGMEYYTLKHGAQMLAGIMQIDPAWGAFPPQWITYFSVANVDETVATVIAHGGKVMGGIDESPFGRIAALADSSGATFKVVEAPQG
jgi:predicted enzyme related to lactoylglutathione lyase